MKKLFLLISLFFVNSIVSQNEIKYQDLNTEDLELFSWEERRVSKERRTQ